MDLDALDKKLLNLVQGDIPITAEPYKELGRQLNISETEVIERLQKLKEQGIIRRLGGIFDSRKLGYKGTLCALKVPAERIEEVAQVVNRYPGITHNYLRSHEYNMWFTVLAESPAEVAQILQEISVDTGITEVLNLPAERFFKLMVNFKLNEVDDDNRAGKKNSAASTIWLTPGTSSVRANGRGIGAERERAID